MFTLFILVYNYASEMKILIIHSTLCSGTMCGVIIIMLQERKAQTYQWVPFDANSGRMNAYLYST